MLPVRMPLTAHHMGPCMSRSSSSIHVILSDAHIIKGSIYSTTRGDALDRKCHTEAFSRMSQDLVPSREVATTARTQYTARHSSAHETFVLM